MKYNNHLTAFILPIFIKLYNKNINIKRRKIFIRLLVRRRRTMEWEAAALSAPAEANIGRGFCIKAVARYAVLTNIFLLFFSTAAGIVLKNF